MEKKGQQRASALCTALVEIRVRAQLMAARAGRGQAPDSGVCSTVHRLVPLLERCARCITHSSHDERSAGVVGE